MDAIGYKDWIQAGWKFYHDYNKPKQYAEYCVHCMGLDRQRYFMYDTFATQDWGNYEDYRVYNDGSTWRAIVGTTERANWPVHSGTAKIMAKSEIHDTFMNPLETTFELVKYKDSSDNLWYPIGIEILDQDFPYAVNSLNAPDNFRTYRLSTREINIPVASKSFP